MAYHPDPASEAEVARLVLHELSLATRAMDDPADSYPVLASLTSAMTSLQQVLGQLADVHDRLADHVTDPVGDTINGHRTATAAAASLRDSAAHLATATHALDEAWSASGQLVWPRSQAVIPSAFSRPSPSRAPRAELGLGS